MARFMPSDQPRRTSTSLVPSLARASDGCSPLLTSSATQSESDAVPSQLAYVLALEAIAQTVKPRALLGCRRARSARPPSASVSEVSTYLDAPSRRSWCPCPPMRAHPGP